MAADPRKTIIYSALSIDGYISTPDGSVDWLDDFDPPEGQDYGYSKFYKSLDTTIMGRKTYDKILTFDVPWPYPDTTNYVCTKSDQWTDNAQVNFRNDPVELVTELKRTSGKNIWIVGGGEINTHLLENELVDEMILAVIPFVLGSGIKLFREKHLHRKFQLMNSNSFSNGVIVLHYQNA